MILSRRQFLESEKIKGYLNISRKAGYLIIGGETLANYKKKLYLILYDRNAGNNTIKIVAKLQEKNIKCYEIEGLSQLISIPNCKIFGIKNKNISEIIESLLNK